MTEPSDPTVPLPDVVSVTQAFNARLPSQRFLDLVRQLEPGLPFNEIATEMPFRLVAFRALLRDYPGRDQRSLWMHAYDVEVEVVEVDPTNGKSSTPGQPSAPITAAYPAT
jgi:hypothetical protein